MSFFQQVGIAVAVAIVCIGAIVQFHKEPLEKRWGGGSMANAMMVIQEIMEPQAKNTAIVLEKHRTAEKSVEDEDHSSQCSVTIPGC